MHRQARASAQGARARALSLPSIFSAKRLVRFGAQLQFAQRAGACVSSVAGIRKLVEYCERTECEAWRRS